MKLLTIAYNYPPIRGPEAIQANRLVKYAMEQNMEFDIVTRYIGHGYKFRNRIKEYGNIYRAFSLDNFYVKGAMRVIGHDLERLPDAEVLWYHFALKKAKICLQNNYYDVIYTRSVPFTSHLIGLKLKQEFKLPWIAHFSDPWTDNPYVQYQKDKTRSKNLEWEKKVMEQADKLIFTSRETVELVMGKYDESLFKKAYVLPHSYDPESIKDLNHTKSEGIPYRISYIGNFYGKRSPKDLFKAIGIAQDQKPDLERYINFHFFGSMPGRYVSEINNTQIQKLIKYHGEVSYQESQKEMELADVLVNIDAPGELNVFLPSKIIEYLAFDKPILSLTPDKGTVNRILKEAGHLCVQNQDHEQLGQIILKIAKEGTGWIDYDPYAKKNYHPLAVAGQFMRIIAE
ncbi:MAG: hypothetical protein PHE79_05410 [Eubacteriales bacterium]|nr:hypothetical protein [Eubacteriales bacterium]